MRYVVTINNTNYEVEVDKGQAGVMSTKQISAEAHVAAVQAQAPSTAHTAAPVRQAAKSVPVGAAGGQTVKAPMPGTILDVKVSAGMKIKKGAVLLILEAMKMENEIVAPADGTVVQIQAAKGASVNAGDLLAVIQ